MKKIEDFLDDFLDTIRTYPRELLVLKLTLILLLLHAKTSWALHVPMRIICSFMLLSDKLVVSKFLWALIVLFLTFANGLQWYIIDNHQYLITYWCLVCFISLQFKNIDQVLKENARIIIGLVFLFATTWKIISLEYFDGSFLHFSILTDERMKLFGIFGGNMKEDLIQENYLIFEYFSSALNLPDFITLNSSNQLIFFSVAFSYLTLLIEGLIAVVFLLKTNLFQKIKDWVLISFIIVTYFTIPVIGFGFILTIMGIAQLDKNRKLVFEFYILAFIIIQLTLIPIEESILKFIR